MSLIGTGIAAGVAQTGLQSREVTTQRSKEVRQKEEAKKRLKAAASEHLQAVQDGDVVDLGGDAVKSDVKPDFEVQSSDKYMSPPSSELPDAKHREIKHLDLKA